MTSTAYFLCPDDDRPFGGIRVIYRFVDILNAAGIRAAVAHHSSRFRCTWFENDTRIVGVKDIRLEKGDLLVFPERYREVIPRVAPGVANIVFNQNAYETFTHIPFTPGVRPKVTSDDTLGIVCVSEENQRYLELCFPETRIERVKLGIDTDLFHENSSGKRRAIAYMPRKRLKELTEMLHILERRGSLEGWELVPIQEMTESETAHVLGGSAIFLALNEREGLALPSLEAMASGCVVVGFHGGVGLEYMRPGSAIPIGDGDIIAMVLEVESVISRWGRDESLDLMTTAAVNLVRREYSRQVETLDVVRIFSDVLERTKDVQPRLERLNVKMLPRRSLWMKIGERLLAAAQRRRPGLG